MLSSIKTCAKSLFRLCGLKVTRIPQSDWREWFKEMNLQTVLDIGANTGQFAAQIHRLLPEAKIYSFEPLKDCYDALSKRMEHVPKFQAFNFALGDTSGPTQIYRNDYTPTSSLLPMEELLTQTYPFTSHAVAQEIQIRRLDDVSDELDIVKNVLVKVDVQGAEDKVIDGGKKTISQASVLIVETAFQPLYVNQPLFGDIYDMLKERFRYMGLLGELRTSKIDGSPVFGDSIFVKRQT